MRWIYEKVIESEYNDDDDDDDSDENSTTEL